MKTYVNNSNDYVPGKAAMMRNLVDKLPEMLFTFQSGDGKPQLQFVSEGCESILELPSESLMKNPSLFWEHVYPEDLPRLKWTLFHSYKKRQSVHWQGRMITDESYRLKWVQLSAWPDKKTKNGNLWHGAIHDITRQKSLEQNLSFVNHENASKAMDNKNIFATLSHEIRTPLSGIIGITDAMMLDEDSDNQEELRLIKFSANQLMSMVNNILSYSKLESGKMELSKQEVCLRQLMESVKSMHNHSASENSTEILIEVDPEVPSIIMADETVLYQILNNLLGNAIKFTKNGSVTLRLEQEKKNGNCSQVRIGVEDTGTGIAPDQLQAIFRQYEQADGFQNHAGGTGLGLPISKRLVEMMGGSLQVQSTFGKGSYFSFSTPMEVVA